MKGAVSAVVGEAATKEATSKEAFIIEENTSELTILFKFQASLERLVDISFNTNTGKNTLFIHERFQINTIKTTNQASEFNE